MTDKITSTLTKWLKADGNQIIKCCSMWEIISAGFLSRFYDPAPMTYSKASFSGAKTKPAIDCKPDHKTHVRF
jgi:hypothetical protein